MNNVKKPGENTDDNGGIYQEIGPRGGEQPNYATVADNRQLPPTSKPGHKWKLARRTPDSKR